MTPSIRVQRRTGRRLVGLAALTAIGAAALAPATSQAKSKEDPVSPGPGSMARVVDVIGARRAWSAGITGDGVTVAVIDTGVAPVDALSGEGKIVASVDLSGEAAIPEARYLDTYGHGTHMTGIIAGATPGADPTASADHPEWFMGVAPGAAIVSVKVGDNTGAVDVSQVIAGLDWTVQHAEELGIRVINLSYGTDATQPYQIDPLAEAVERAWKSGIVVVVAAGNDGRGTKQLANPAHDPYVIAVAAADVQGDGKAKVPSWVTSGDGTRNPDVSAPGAHIESLRVPGSRIDSENPAAVVGDDRFLGSGSSQAAAVVSGAAALMIDARPELSPDEVKAILMSTARPFSNAQVEFQGRGLIDVTAALLAPRPKLAIQLWPASDGSGSLEASRGTHHVVIGADALTGEVDVTGASWRGGAWTGDAWAGASWRSDDWAGASWRGVSWHDSSWSGAAWLGASWRDTAWSGASWRDGSWSGASWRDSSWSGASWRDGSWSGASWRGNSWADSTWS